MCPEKSCWNCKQVSLGGVYFPGRCKLNLEVEIAVDIMDKGCEKWELLEKT